MSETELAADSQVVVSSTASNETSVTALPQKIVRVARKGCTWGMSRRFYGYRAVGVDQLSVRGAAPKFVIRSESNPLDWYIAKSAESCGQVETLTELLNNLVGQGLGFRMAHAGLLRADGELRFASRNFQGPEETLIHGSLLFQQAFNDDLHDVGKNNWDEQRTYDIALIDEVLKHACGDAAKHLLGCLIEMLVFDSLIGSMDRHMQNWGLLATVGEPRQYRFAPIFDSARALLWNCNEDKLKVLMGNQEALNGYLNRSRPKIGSSSKGRAMSHFGLIEHLIDVYPEPALHALEKVHPKKVNEIARIVREFPFSGIFSRERKHLISKVLETRADKLLSIAQGRR
jgi:hypothetical protein